MSAAGTSTPTATTAAARAIPPPSGPLCTTRAAAEDRVGRGSHAVTCSGFRQGAVRRSGHLPRTIRTMTRSELWHHPCSRRRPGGRMTWLCLVLTASGAEPVELTLDEAIDRLHAQGPDVARAEARADQARALATQS